MSKNSQSRGDRGTVQLVELLQVAIDHANDGIAIMKFTSDSDVPIRIVYANEAIERLSGYSHEELLDPSNPFLRVQPQNRAHYETLLLDVRAGKPVRFEVELGGKDRSTWTEIRWSPLRYSGGVVTHYVAVLRDITERRRAQAERELLYRAIEQARDGICIIELSGGDPRRRRATYANAAVCEMLKMSREQILAEGVLAGLVFAENPELREQYIADVSRGATFVRELLARRGDGTPRWIQMTASPFKVESERAEEWLVLFHDIEDRKRNGEQLALFQSILSQTSDFVVVADATRPSKGGPKVTYANPSFAALVALEPAHIVGRVFVEFLSPRNDGKAVASVISQLEHHQGISHELLLHRPDGNDLWIELTGHHVRGESGQPVSWFFIGKDISVRKHGYTQTAQLIAALDLAEEPIVIYDVIKPLELEMQHMNERAMAREPLLLENLLLDPLQRERIGSAWLTLEGGRSVHRLVRVGENDSRRWVTLEIRPMGSGKGSPGSIIAIEHELRLAAYDWQPDSVGTALALSREILGYKDLGDRRDAFLEVLREEWGAQGSFSRTNRDIDLVLRVKENNGYMVTPRGVLFDQSVAVDFSWSGAILPRRLTALRIFLETLIRSD